jgi:hypothetical protein
MVDARLSHGPLLNLDSLTCNAGTCAEEAFLDPFADVCCQIHTRWPVPCSFLSCLFLLSFSSGLHNCRTDVMESSANPVSKRRQVSRPIADKVAPRR